MQSDWLVDFTDWIYTQPLNLVLRETLWVIPMAQAVHIAAIGIVIVPLIMIYLRVLGLFGRHMGLAEYVQRYSSWIWGGAVVLLLSGSVMIYAEPDRPLLSGTFQLKMLFVILALTIMAIFQSRLKHNTNAWQTAPAEALAGRAAAILSLSLVVAIVFAGRLTAYI